MQDTKILRFPQLHDRIALSRSTIWRKIKAGEFPKPVQISAKAIGWLAADVDAWIASRNYTTGGQS